MAKPAAKPAAKAAPANTAAAPAKSNKLLIIIIAVLVLIIAGGVGWYFTQDHAPATEHAEGAKAAPAAAAAPRQPKYIPLGEKFTVNLQQEEGDRYLQVGITLKIFDAKLEETIKAAMPEIRSKLLLLLSSKRPSELVSSEGKQRLVQQIIAEVDAILEMGAAPAAAGHGAEHAAPPAAKTSGVVDVLFTDFIIQ